MTAAAPLFCRTLLFPTTEAPELDLLQDALTTAFLDSGDLSLLRRLPPVRPGWFLGSPALVYRWTPDLDSPGARIQRPLTVLVDSVAESLPEALSGGALTEDVAAAWALGCFGAGAAPGALRRALRHPGWPDAAAMLATHRGVVRIRLSYAFGQGDDAHPNPADRDRTAERALLTALALPILELPTVLGWLHAPGEALRQPREVRRALQHARDDKRLPIELWTHARVTPVADTGGWLLVDTVGMEDFGARDVELAVAPDSVAIEDAVRFVRNLSLYAVAEHDRFKAGHTAEGPAGRLIARPRGRGVLDPPRRVVRWVPVGGPSVPHVLQY